MTGQRVIPYSFEQAREACARATRAQESAEDALLEASRDFAAKEEAYRVALARRIVTAHDTDGIAWTVAPDIARGDEHVAALRKARDIAEGVREALQQACWRRIADRKDTQRLVDWSARRDLAEYAGRDPEPEPETPITYGGTRA